MPLTYLHTMVRVKDLEKSMAFYELLGLRDDLLDGLVRRECRDGEPVRMVRIASTLHLTECRVSAPLLP